MKILIAGETFPPDVNGAGIFTQRLSQGLARRRHDVHVVVPSPAGYSYEEECRGVRFHYIASHRYPWHETFHIADLRKARAAVGDVIRGVTPDVVHIQAHFVVGRLAAAQSKKYGIPLIATNHFMPENLRHQLPFKVPRHVYNSASSVAWWDLGRILRSADVVTAPTQYAVDLLRTRAGIEAATVVSCGIEVSEYCSAQTKSQSDNKTVLFVGRLDKEKHVDEIISAVALLDRTVHLRIVGEGRQRDSLRRLAINRGIGDRVTLLGFIPDEDLRAEYRQADVFCMPGTAELQSIATLEAMASGLPIVAADACALPALVTPGSNGQLFPPGNAELLADAIRWVLADGRRRIELGMESTRKARQHEFASTLNVFEGIYNKMVSAAEKLMPD
jgi:glycosyltransferase involved in cell wall biosynthesis